MTLIWRAVLLSCITPQCREVLKQASTAHTDTHSRKQHTSHSNCALLEYHAHVVGVDYSVVCLDFVTCVELLCSALAAAATHENRVKNELLMKLVETIKWTQRTRVTPSNTRQDSSPSPSSPSLTPSSPSSPSTSSSFHACSPLTLAAPHLVNTLLNT